ncbi:MAG: hypothetical protein AAB686_02685 [Patescibacteria group bacterium]
MLITLIVLAIVALGVAGFWFQNWWENQEAAQKLMIKVLGRDTIPTPHDADTDFRRANWADVELELLACGMVFDAARAQLQQEWDEGAPGEFLDMAEDAAGKAEFALQELYHAAQLYGFPVRPDYLGYASETAREFHIVPATG